MINDYQSITAVAYYNDAAVVFSLGSSIPIV